MLGIFGSAPGGGGGGREGGREIAARRFDFSEVNMWSHYSRRLSPPHNMVLAVYLVIGEDSEYEQISVWSKPKAIRHTGYHSSHKRPVT